MQQSLPKWRPSASLKNLKLRAQTLARVRAFFSERDIMEVETPILSGAASTDPFLESFISDYDGPGGPRRCYLQTSPEFFMKRLLAAGSGAIYQIGKAFRNGEMGGQHNPEFTMLEWYRPGFTHHDLMDEVEALVRMVLPLPEAKRYSYQALFLEFLNIDPHRASAESLRNYAQSQKINVSHAGDINKDTWLSLLLTHLIEPKLGTERPVFVYDFPASQAMLARVSGHRPALAQRFELYIGGMELANGFYELQDDVEQRCRFERDIADRASMGLATVPMDLCLVEALQSGLPDCSGVALGVDRLLMLVTNANDLSEVVSFSFDKV